ncbi:hypothetical protein CCAX7_60620 [Capsulimonas corticalis]|uniref:Uncharacterized protein n=1 Tax=Capsulimonas corticalis TaxID=2219043 RepID=A0A402CW43_9BACT|nr:hypothetical protein CCAX7_60620 [Capsulimonas corticalis]
MLRKFIAAFVGMGVGFLIGAATVKFIVMPWENRTDPGGYNYTLWLYIIFGLIVTTWIGLYCGLEVEWASSQRQRKLRAQGEDQVKDESKI